MENKYEAAYELLDIIKKKQSLLDNIIRCLEIQADCFEDQTFEEDTYESMESKTSDYLETLNQYNEKSDLLFPAAKSQIEEMVRRKDSFADSIRQEINDLNRLSAKMETAMDKVKGRLKEYLAYEQNQIKGKRMQKKSAATYYKNMTSQMDMTSYFYDKKK